MSADSKPHSELVKTIGRGLAWEPSWSEHFGEGKAALKSLEEQFHSLERDFDRMKARHDHLDEQNDELVDSESRLLEQLEAARRTIADWHEEETRLREQLEARTDWNASEVEVLLAALREIADPNSIRVRDIARRALAGVDSFPASRGDDGA